MKKNNIWRIVWMVGVYAILLLILFLVIQYKVKWEGKDLSTYLYFYNCSSNLCTTTNKVSSYYSRVKCNDNCPYIKEKSNNLVILSDGTKDYVFDYINEAITNNKYLSYKFSKNNYIVKNSNGNYGVIDEVGDEVVEAKYKEIIDYNSGYIAYNENGKIGIINESENIDIKPIYEDVILINGSSYAYLEDGKYYIASYSTELPINSTNYDYIYVIDENNILVINDKKLDIIDSNLRSVLILKLDTYYEYGVEKERNSLNITREDSIIRFHLVQPEGKTLNYIYDIKNKKLYN